MNYGELENLFATNGSYETFNDYRVGDIEIGKIDTQTFLDYYRKLNERAERNEFARYHIDTDKKQRTIRNNSQ